MSNPISGSFLLFKMSNFRNMMSSEESEHFMLAWDEFTPVLVKIKYIFHMLLNKIQKIQHLFI